MFRSAKSGGERALSGRRQLTPDERQASFFQGAALALLPSIFLLPLWFFLLRAPRLAHGRTIAALAFSVVAGLIAQGVRKLVGAMDLKDTDLTTVMAFGVLVVLAGLLVYAAVVVFALLQTS